MNRPRQRLVGIALSAFALALAVGACGKDEVAKPTPSDDCVVGAVMEQPIPIVEDPIRPTLFDATKLKTSTPIKHVVFIMKENRTFDNLFGAFPGANGASTGLRGDTTVSLRDHCFPQALPKDIVHDYPKALIDWNEGEMNGFGWSPFAAEWAYIQAKPSDIPNYWRWASDFALSDNFFASAMGPSYPNHLFSIAADSHGTHDNPVPASGRVEIKLTPAGVYQKSWGCDAPDGTYILVDDQNGGKPTEEFPCWTDMRVLMDEMKEAGIPWAYYGADKTQLGYFWDAPDYIGHIRNKLLTWESHVFGINQIVPDIRDGRLPPVTWVTPQFWTSDHPDASLCNGENWTTQIVNAVMQSDHWKDTAIFIVWDDWGGFYDHVPPPQIDDYGLGFRVPALTLSPYAKQGYIDSKQGEFSSILKFIEKNWGLDALTERDRTASDMTQVFDFTQSPRAPEPLPLRHDCQQFTDERAYDFGDS